MFDPDKVPHYTPDENGYMMEYPDGGYVDELDYGTLLLLYRDLQKNYEEVCEAQGI